MPTHKWSELKEKKFSKKKIAEIESRADKAVKKKKRALQIVRYIPGSSAFSAQESILSTYACNTPEEAEVCNPFRGGRVYQITITAKLYRPKKKTTKAKGE